MPGEDISQLSETKYCNREERLINHVQISLCSHLRWKEVSSMKKWGAGKGWRERERETFIIFEIKRKSVQRCSKGSF
jgi:hypothetical protein